MIAQEHLASINRADRDLYAREKVLNSAIIAVDINACTIFILLCRERTGPVRLEVRPRTPFQIS
jgi:hypothetical protein